MADLIMSADVELSVPFTPADLKGFLSTVPDDARVTVSTFMGGSQRDPYPTGYRLMAKWEVRDV
ncbi:hypothetical protein PTQ19_10140 [Microbacterium esteraromaticum]|uniref:hypothetical protein n=1 Tax=Microbacterium esteraromaticum TaxID=57043 RepID=UPI002367753C|nr:hypothetical protein [Microbacterium esteraromaticum]WDH77880.1 hypothetical protein PTQ19_10140 [Microbacterium esteraromaticum]